MSGSQFTARRDRLSSTGQIPRSRPRSRARRRARRPPTSASRSRRARRRTSTAGSDTRSWKRASDDPAGDGAARCRRRRRRSEPPMRPRAMVLALRERRGRPLDAGGVRRPTETALAAKLAELEGIDRDVPRLARSVRQAAETLHRVSSAPLSERRRCGCRDRARRRARRRDLDLRRPTGGSFVPDRSSFRQHRPLRARGRDVDLARSRSSPIAANGAGRRPGRRFSE